MQGDMSAPLTSEDAAFRLRAVGLRGTKPGASASPKAGLTVGEFARFVYGAFSNS